MTADEILRLADACIGRHEARLYAKEYEALAAAVRELERERDALNADWVRLGVLYGQWRERAEKAEQEVKRLRELLPVLDGMIDTRCPTPVEWWAIGERVKQLKAVLGESR